MCRVSLVSQGTSWLVRGYGALISIWICSSRQGSFSSCQHSPAHRFQSLKWSIILFYLFAASLPAATVECDPVVVFRLWLQCKLHGVLKLSAFGICNLFADGMLVFVLFLVAEMVIRQIRDVSFPAGDWASFSFTAALITWGPICSWTAGDYFWFQIRRLQKRSGVFSQTAPRVVVRCGCFNEKFSTKNVFCTTLTCEYCSINIKHNPFFVILVWIATFSLPLMLLRLCENELPIFVFLRPYRQVQQTGTREKLNVFSCRIASFVSVHPWHLI